MSLVVPPAASRQRAGLRVEGGIGYHPFQRVAGQGRQVGDAVARPEHERHLRHDVGKGIVAREVDLRGGCAGHHLRRGEDVPAVPAVVADGLGARVDGNDVVDRGNNRVRVPGTESDITRALEIIWVVARRPRAVALQRVVVGSRPACHHVDDVACGKADGLAVARLHAGQSLVDACRHLGGHGVVGLRGFHFVVLATCQQPCRQQREED